MTGKEPKPDEPRLSFEMAQTPVNWVCNAIILSGILAAAAAVVGSRVAEHFRENSKQETIIDKDTQ